MAKLSEFGIRAERVAAGIAVQIMDEESGTWITVAVADSERSVDQAMHGVASLCAASIKTWMRRHGREGR